PLNEWTHITVVGSSSGLRIYINGELDASNSVPYGALNTADTLEIGAEPQFSGYFNGTIDEVRIYDRALSPQEILA
ncbi:MAG: LamG domain-containing protein, partial [Candidatus Aenigmarchaeota archaeon]|nr:LamG domain-containing protein [Candidatus Aenigmarchaeota archaeon]